MSKESISVFWFRRDIRLKDNTALNHALEGRYPVLPVFIFDPIILESLENKSDARVGFIFDQIQRLKKETEERGSTIYIFCGKPLDVFKKLDEKYLLKEVFANRDYEPYAADRDEKVSKFLSGKNIRFNLFKDHLIFEGREILKRDGSPYRVFTPFQKKWTEKFKDLSILENNENIPFEKCLQTDPAPAPTLRSVGFQESKIKIPKAEIPVSLLEQYDKNRDFPARNGTSRLGIHLRFGTISIREVVKTAAAINRVWLNELIWREFYSSVLQHYPYVTAEAFNRKYNFIAWRNDPVDFHLWCVGKTGYPLVDAGMRELNQTGYMHNRVRMVTASFLTKHLLIDWRLGEAYFAGKLLDFELASNNGGWQWAAGTGTDAQPYFRIFNPENQAAKFDPDMTYIKHWVPEYGSGSYPRPVVDHNFARKRAVETYKSSLP